MEFEIEIIKDIPINQIKNFEKKVIYNTAVYTREFTKGANAYPYLTGRLQSSEIASSIVGSGFEYGLTAGVSYAKDVWLKTKANWTNPSTQPQWYYSIFNKQGASIVHQAVNTALKEV